MLPKMSSHKSSQIIHTTYLLHRDIVTAAALATKGLIMLSMLQKILKRKHRANGKLWWGETEMRIFRLR